MHNYYILLLLYVIHAQHFIWKYTSAGCRGNLLFSATQHFDKIFKTFLLVVKCLLSMSLFSSAIQHAERSCYRRVRISLSTILCWTALSLCKQIRLLLKFQAMPESLQNTLGMSRHGTSVSQKVLECESVGRCRKYAEKHTNN